MTPTQQPPGPALHEWDDDGCCVHCGYDGAEYVWWRRHTYEGLALKTPMPPCRKALDAPQSPANNQD